MRRPVSAGVVPAYDKAGNTLSYDSDGAGALTPKAFTYDAENRPLVVTAQGATTRFEYGADGARLKKFNATATTWYVSPDAEMKVDSGTPAGPWTTCPTSGARAASSIS